MPPINFFNRALISYAIGKCKSGSCRMKLFVGDSAWKKASSSPLVTKYPATAQTSRVSKARRRKNPLSRGLLRKLSRASRRAGAERAVCFLLIDKSYGRGGGVGGGRGAGVTRGAGVGVTVVVGVGDGVTDGSDGVGVAVGVGVGVKPGCAQYLPPVFRSLLAS